MSESVRKYLYLITEHEQQDRVGGVSFMDQQMSRPLKNEEGPITVLDDDKEDFRQIGMKVGMGYYDFENQSAYENNENCAAVIEEKLSEIDEVWLEKAGIDPSEYFSGDNNE